MLLEYPRPVIPQCCVVAGCIMGSLASYGRLSFPARESMAPGASGISRSRKGTKCLWRCSQPAGENSMYCQKHQKAGTLAMETVFHVEGDPIIWLWIDRVHKRLSLLHLPFLECTSCIVTATGSICIFKELAPRHCAQHVLKEFERS